MLDGEHTALLLFAFVYHVFSCVLAHKRRSLLSSEEDHVLRLSRFVPVYSLSLLHINHGDGKDANCKGY